VNKYVVSCGGDVVMRGKKAFRVGVQEPGEIESNLMMILNAPPGGVVTSGHYARFFKIDGHEYSHIIDPATGWPAKKTLASITVWGKEAEDADALATALAVFGLKNAVEFLKRSDDYSGILLAKAGDGYEIHYSKSLADKIEFIGKWEDVPRVEF
jgi:thiamine biosynthesis lipoprotein